MTDDVEAQGLRIGDPPIEDMPKKYSVEPDYLASSKKIQDLTDKFKQIKKELNDLEDDNNDMEADLNGIKVCPNC